MASQNKVNRLNLISKSQKLKPNKKVLPFNQPRTKQPKSLSSRHSDSVVQQSVFLQNPIKSRNLESRQLKSYRYPTGNNTDREDQKFTERYMKIMSQSLGKNQVKLRVAPEPEPKGFRAASFLSRLLERAKKSSQQIPRKPSMQSNEIKQELRFEINEVQGFIPVSKAKKSPSFFEQPLKKPTHRSNISTQLQKIPRYLDEYLTYVGAPTNDQYIFTQTFGRFRGLKKKTAIQLLDIRVAYAICNVLKLTGQVIQDVETDYSKKEECIKEYCHLYFSLDEKIPFQTLVSGSLLQGFMSRLRELFLSIRITFYGILSLCSEHKLFFKSTEQLNQLISLLSNLETAYTIIIQSIADIKESMANDIDHAVNRSFKILRNMYEVEKQCQKVKIDTKQFNVGRTFASKASWDIEKHLLSLLSKTSLTSFQEKLLYSEAIMNWKYLLIPPIPYLPPLVANITSQYTIVLDIDGTLIWYDESKRLVKERPGLKVFLESVSKHYQIVAFTTSTKDYADRILRSIDPKSSFIKYRLYREHIRIQDEKMIKDITKLGRDLSKTIIIDDTPELFRGSIKNGIKVETWRGNPLDEVLSLLLPMLLGLVNQHPQDIRELIRPYQQVIGYISEKQEQSLS